MARKLTKKQRDFVNEYVDTGNGTESALAAYDTQDPEVAKVIASQNLTKPQIQEELKALGFDSNNAKRVIGEILNKENAEDKDRLKAGELVLKTNGDLGGEKTPTVQHNTINFFSSNEIQEKVNAFEADLIQKIAKN